MRIEIGNHEGFRRFRHDVLQEIAIVIGHRIFLVEKKFHAFRTALEGDDKDIRLFAAAFDEMALIRLDEDHLPLLQRHPLAFFDDGNVFLVRVDQFPKIVRFLLGRVRLVEFLIVYRHDFLHVQEIGDFVHIKLLCPFPCFSRPLL